MTITVSIQSASKYFTIDPVLYLLAGFNSARHKHGLRAWIDTLISRLRKNHTREVTHHEYSADCACDGSGSDYNS